MALYVATKVSVVKPQFDPSRAFMTLRAFEACSTQSRAWGPKVKWVSSVTPKILGVHVQPSHHVTNSHFRVEVGLVGVGSEVSRWISGEQWPVACHLSTSPKRSIVGFPSPLPPRCLGRWRIPVRPPHAPGGKASGAADKGARPSCRGGMPQATQLCCVGSGGSSRWGGGEKRCRRPSKYPPLWLWLC